MPVAELKEMIDKVAAEISRLSNNVEDICGDTSLVYETKIKDIQLFTDQLNTKLTALEERFDSFEKYIRMLRDSR